MTSRKLSGPQAWENASRVRHSRWGKMISRFDGGLVEAVMERKFLLQRSERFFCIGSCFARNIEEHLICRDVEVLSRRVYSPQSEWNARPNGFLNKFTSHSMRNELEWLISPPGIDETLFSETADGWLDLQLSPGIAPVTLERAIERRRYLLADYFSRIRDASVVVMTLGLNEVWFDRLANRHLNAPPNAVAARREPDRFELQVTDANENLAELERIREILLQLRPDMKIVLTVSPVPMSVTFTGQDVLVANTLSKSVLRSAAEAFTQAHDDVAYFPSYDMITNSPRSDVYKDDRLHVTDEAVGEMMSIFLQLYMKIERSDPPFNEHLYLANNPDVMEALRSGELDSGYRHWKETGRAEGRKAKGRRKPSPVDADAE